MQAIKEEIHDPEIPENIVIDIKKEIKPDPDQKNCKECGISLIIAGIKHKSLCSSEGNFENISPKEPLESCHCPSPPPLSDPKTEESDKPERKPIIFSTDTSRPYFHQHRHKRKLGSTHWKNRRPISRHNWQNAQASVWANGYSQMSGRNYHSNTNYNLNNQRYGNNYTHYRNFSRDNNYRHQSKPKIDYPKIHKKEKPLESSNFDLFMLKIIQKATEFSNANNVSQTSNEKSLLNPTAPQSSTLNSPLSNNNVQNEAPFVDNCQSVNKDPSSMDDSNMELNKISPKKNGANCDKILEDFDLITTCSDEVTETPIEDSSSNHCELIDDVKHLESEPSCNKDNIEVICEKLVVTADVIAQDEPTNNDVEMNDTINGDRTTEEVEESHPPKNGSTVEADGCPSCESCADKGQVELNSKMGETSPRSSSFNESEDIIIESIESPIVCLPNDSSAILIKGTVSSCELNCGDEDIEVDSECEAAEIVQDDHHKGVLESDLVVIDEIPKARDDLHIVHENSADEISVLNYRKEKKFCRNCFLKWRRKKKQELEVVFLGTRQKYVPTINL